MSKRQRLGLSTFFLVFLTIMSLVVTALPEGADITLVNTSTRGPSPSQTLDATAGNVSQLNVFAYTTTNAWQGYYGNVSGTIGLGDSAGSSLYNWQTISPSGQIYASTSQLDFADGNIQCYNFSRTGGGYLNLSTYEASLGLSESSVDGINETFNETLGYDPFYVSTAFINHTCPTVYLFNSTNQSSPNTFQEVLLYDLTANDVIFTSLLRRGGIVGFDGNVWDFQMIVAEDGHSGDVAVTSYYFYVQLE